MTAPAASQSCDVSCPVQRTAQVLDGKWTILVLRDLLGGTKRYSELQRSLAGISPRLLAARLKALEAQGIVLRTAYPTVPPTTEYALTIQGKALMPVVQAMASFGNDLLAHDKQLQARAAQVLPLEPIHIARVRSGKRVT